MEFKLIFTVGVIGSVFPGSDTLNEPKGSDHDPSSAKPLRKRRIISMIFLLARTVEELEFTSKKGMRALSSCFVLVQSRAALIYLDDCMYSFSGADLSNSS